MALKRFCDWCGYEIKVTVYYNIHIAPNEITRASGSQTNWEICQSCKASIDTLIKDKERVKRYNG